jgi:hypothetical protein
VSTGGLFINYRGDDSNLAAELIDRDLAAEFGRDRVFLDCRSLHVGTDFVQGLLDGVRRCRVLLVLIGPRWLTLTAPDGSRRIDDPADWIRREIAEAFKAGVRGVPVRLDDTPRLTEGGHLPADISARPSQERGRSDVDVVEPPRPIVGPADIEQAVSGESAEERMWAFYLEEQAAGRTPTGAELDRVAGTNNYGRRVLRRWRTTGRGPDGCPASAVLAARQLALADKATADGTVKVPEPAG